MEEALTKQLVLVLLEERRDQWGNIIENPIVKALGAYYSKNEKAIMDIIVSKFTNEEIAEKIAKKLGDRYAWEANQLEKSVKDKVIDILAQRELVKLESKTL